MANIENNPNNQKSSAINKIIESVIKAQQHVSFAESVMKDGSIIYAKTALNFADHKIKESYKEIEKLKLKN